ncbi:MAG: carbohydrate porin, partial [Alphaproteobacteria bacterium]|nr:carbohydrate porin [Alphaproteobacteria bacterium]
MNLTGWKNSVAAGGLVAIFAAGTGNAASSEAIEARLRTLEAEIAKLRREARQAKIEAQQAAHAAQSSVAKAEAAQAAAPPPPPPVLVSFKNGLFVETADKAYNFKIGGRMQFDGGGTTQPLNGWSDQAGVRQVRLEIEGKAAQYWFYKLQYDFAGSQYG